VHSYAYGNSCPLNAVQKYHLSHLAPSVLGTSVSVYQESLVRTVRLM
jgi:hypothetical protein